MSLIALALAAALQTSPAAAAAPKPGCRIGLIADLPVTFEHNQPVVEVAIDGHPVWALIDTGAGVSTLFESSAKRLGLKLRDLPNVRMFGVDGEVKAHAAHLEHFSLMGASSPPFDMMVSGQGGRGVDMLLGEDLLSLVDIEFDLAHAKVKLIRPNACADDEMAYWATDSYSEAPFAEDERHNIRLDVKLNGMRVSAILDSGASASVATEHAAFAANVPLEAAPSGKFTGVAGKAVTRRIGVVKTVTVGDETVRNAPLSFGALYRTQFAADSGSRIATDENLDMLLGADFLRSHHVLVSRSRSKLYFTYNGGPVFRQEAAPASAKETPAS